MEEGLGLFVVPLATPGLAVRQVAGLDPSLPLADITFDAVMVPEDRVLGTPGSPEVADALERAVEQASVALALEAVGVCQVLLDLTITHAKDRHQFGVPIGSFQAVKHRLADAYISLERARVLAYFATAAIAEDDSRRAVASAMAKAAADDCQQVVCLDAIQTFGGIGFTWESDVHLYVKRGGIGRRLVRLGQRAPPGSGPDLRRRALTLRLPPAPRAPSPTPSLRQRRACPRRCRHRGGAARGSW